MTERIDSTRKTARLRVPRNRGCHETGAQADKPRDSSDHNPPVCWGSTCRGAQKLRWKNKRSSTMVLAVLIHSVTARIADSSNWHTSAVSIFLQVVSAGLTRRVHASVSSTSILLKQSESVTSGWEKASNCGKSSYLEHIKIHLRGKKNSEHASNSSLTPLRQATSSYVGIGLAMADGVARMLPGRIVILTTSASTVLAPAH